jgi:hypothetical protein
MIRRKEEGWTNKKIARVYDITPRRLQQLWAQYRSTGHMPTLHNLHVSSKTLSTGEVSD